jgi:hypothetical protein
MVDGVFIFIQFVFDRLLGPRTRADELRDVRRRLAGRAGPRVASPEEVRLALRLRVLRESLCAQLGRVEACTCCVRPRSLDWPGGHCCSGRTEDLFTEDELAALKLSGTTSSQLRSPLTGHAGCAFRGPLGCSLPPAHRPSLCVRYMCFDLQRELDLREDNEETNRLQAEIRRGFECFVNLRKARLRVHGGDLLEFSRFHSHFIRTRHREYPSCDWVS